MLHLLLEFLFKKSREARRKAEASYIKYLNPPSHYMENRPWHIPDPAPDKLPWKKSKSDMNENH